MLCPLAHWDSSPSFWNHASAGLVAGPVPMVAVIALLDSYLPLGSFFPFLER